MKLIIAGTRTFNDYELLCSKLNAILKNTKEPIEIVSGGATGADRLGEWYARHKNLALRVIPAAWHLYGKSAGVRRNKEMAQYATHCIVFWDGISRGTSNMIELAKEYALQLRIILY